MRFGVPLHTREKGPVGWSDITLLDRAPMDRDGRCAKFKRAVKDRKKVSLALCGVVESTPHLESDRAAAVHAFDDCLHDRESSHRLAQQKPTAASAKDLLYGTAEIEINQVIARLGQIVRRLGELLRTTAHELSSDRVVVIANLEQTRAQLPLEDDQFIAENLGHRKFSAVAAGNNPHRPV